VRGEAIRGRFFAGASAPRPGRAAALLVCLFLYFLALAQGAHANTLTPEQQAIIAKIAKPSAASHVEYAGQSTDPFGAEVRLPFRDGFITLKREGSSFRDDGSITWQGEVEETGERAVLMLWGKALLTGYFAYKGTIFAVESLGGGVEAFKELGREGQLPDHPTPGDRPQGDAIAPAGAGTTPHPEPPDPSVPPFPDSERKALEAKNITIDIMLVYTPSVAKHYTREPDDLLTLAIDETNQIFRNSGLGNVRLRLVHTQLIDYEARKGDQFNDLYAMVDGVGPFKDVKKLRNEKRADIVGLIIDNPTGCGLSTRIGPDSDDAFFVVHHACGTITMSIAHEIGHILGVRHDRLVDGTDTPFAYGHGYVDASKWRDVMSYNQAYGGCPRIPYFSNPRITYKGEPTGTAAADAARVILELAERVSKFR
jgi:peptidyl-Asp metalloendopeptidase